MNFFLKDQAFFMQVVGQTVGQNNPEQTAMYQTLLAEELAERFYAIGHNDEVEEFDANLDILVVHLGRMLSRWPVEMIEAGWTEVMRSNLSKAVACEVCEGNGWTYRRGITKHVTCSNCDGTGYTVQRREDGKILKGPQYSPPDLKSVIEKYRPKWTEEQVAKVYEDADLLLSKMKPCKQADDQP